jgi:UDP-N-acetylglucosamine 2-epimerase (non-hydrolysing)
VTLKKKLLMVFGTRPEAIKMAPLYHALRAQYGRFETQLCVTAQHRSMLDQVLQAFKIVPDIDLNIMRQGQDLADITSGVLTGVRDVIRKMHPDAVLVHGDTTTALAAATAGFYMGTRVAHVEAGLRTYDLRAPFPEEFNRQAIGKVAQWHFAPTELSRENLLSEGVSDRQITVTGNTVIDALHWMLKRIDSEADLLAQVVAHLNEKLPFDWRASRFVLVTGHRRENFGQGFIDICEAIRELAGNHPDVHFVYPVHLNPNVLEPVNSLLSGIGNIHLIKPLTYEPFVYLLKHSYAVLTDSGGLQEEAPSLGKPVFVMRDVTERPEAVAAGTVKLVGTSKSGIVSNLTDIIESDEIYHRMSRATNPYGDGRASERIIEVLGHSE